MQRGILKHYAHVLPQIFAERILWGFQDGDGVPDDLAALASWGRGHLTIDMIHGTCLRDGRSVEPLWVVGELQGWLARELRKQADPPSDISAVLEVEFSAELDRSTAPWAARTWFDSTVTIESSGQTIVRRLVERN